MYHEPPTRPQALLHEICAKLPEAAEPAGAGAKASVASARPVIYTLCAMTSRLPDSIHTVTFDCRSTLLYEPRSHDKLSGSQRGAARLAASLGVEEASAVAAFSQAWQRHQRDWHRRIASAGRDMLDDTLSTLGARITQAQRALLPGCVFGAAMSRVHVRQAWAACAFAAITTTWTTHPVAARVSSTAWLQAVRHRVRGLKPTLSSRRTPRWLHTWNRSSLARIAAVRPLSRACSPRRLGSCGNSYGKHSLCHLCFVPDACLTRDCRPRTT